MATGLNRNLIIVALAAALVAAAVFVVLERREGTQPLEITLGEPTPGAVGPMEVYITGAVAQPGVYEMADGDRVVDALYEAGGPAPDANLEAINLALRLHDEHHVVVPRLGQPAPALESGTASDVAGAAESLARGDNRAVDAFIAAPRQEKNAADAGRVFILFPGSRGPWGLTRLKWGIPVTRNRLVIGDTTGAAPGDTIQDQRAAVPYRA